MFPLPYSGKVVLFRAQDGMGPQSDGGWGELATGGLALVDIPGNHWTAFESPHVQVLAEHLRRLLESG